MNTLDYNKKYYLDHDLEILKRDGNVLLIDFMNVNWFRTNEMGFNILQQCNGTEIMESVINEIAEVKGFDSNFLKKQFESFLSLAIEKQIILEEGTEKDRMTFVPLSHPNTIWIHVSDKCNLECPFCYSDSYSHSTNNLDSQAVLNFLENLPKDQRKRIIISGGEPFLYSELSQLLKGLKEMEFESINVITNGTVGRNKYSEVLPYIDVLQVSLDGTKPESNDKTRGTGSFEKTIENIRYAKELGVKDLYISLTATKYNIEDLVNFPEFIYEKNIKHLHVTRLLPVGREKKNEENIMPDNEKYSEYLEAFSKNFQHVNQKIYQKRETEEIFLEKDQKTKYRSVTFASDQFNKVLRRQMVTGCGAGDATISIASDGNIYPCTSLANEEQKIGNIFTDSIQEVIENGLKIGEYINVDNIPGCKTCKFRYFCGGGCRACAVNMDVDGILGKDPECENYQKSIIEHMWSLNSVI